MNKKAVVASVMSIATCGSLVAGATYALFTSESKTNIAIQAGKVEVVAWIDDIKTYTFGDEQKANSFALGGSVDYDEESNKLTVDKIAPGDGMDFNVYVENKSDIAVSYRVKVAFAGELQSALVASIELPNTEEATTLTATDVATDWCSFGDSNSVVLPMSVDFPVGAGNENQGKSAEIVVTVEAVQANGTNLVMINNTKYESLAEATAAASSGDTINLYSGNFTLPTDGSLANKTLTFVGDEYAVIDMKNVNTDQSTMKASLTFDGLTMEFGTENYMGIAHATKVAYKNCTLIGKQFMYAPTVEFSKCAFVNYNDYCVWTYGASKATFTDCTFTTGGKAVLVYNEDKSGSFAATVTLTNCTFNSDGTLATDKAAVEAGFNPNKTNTYDLVFTDCTVNGFAPNKSNSALWGNKNDMPASNLTVTVNGDYENGVGTYITIHDVKGLVAFANSVNSVSKGELLYSNKTVVLAQDIDLKNTPWTPIGQTGAGQFGGVFEGNNKTIYNLNVNTMDSVEKENYSSGLFGWLNAGTVKNLTVDGATIVAPRRAAVIAGYLELGAKVINCKVLNATVTCNHVGEANDTIDCGDKAAAVVGYMNSGCKVTNCTAENVTVTAGRDAGQIVGCGKTEDVTGCTATNVTVSSNSDTCKGGNINETVIGRL